MSMQVCGRASKNSRDKGNVKFRNVATITIRLKEKMSENGSLKI